MSKQESFLAWAPLQTQVEAPAGGSWLTITRKEVQATAPVPNTYGQPFAWQGSLPVPYGVLNLWNGNLMVGLFGWDGQTGVAFGLSYNAQDSEAGVRGVGWRHTYDHQGQLVREVRTGQNAYTIEYGYDLVGNRLTRTRTVNGQTFTDGMEYNEANQLVSLNGQEWEYDEDGNVKVRRANGETWLLDYDAEGNLVSLQRQGDAVGWVYEYDGLGRRVRAVRGTLEVAYLYSGDTLVAERANWNGTWGYRNELVEVSGLVKVRPHG
jgi:YD repeat-containing protein